MIWWAVIGFGGLAIAGAWVALYRARKAGEDRISARVTEKTVDVLRKQDAAAAKSPKTKDGLVERLRKGGL
jgi:uncharacterized membrane protein